MSLGALFFPTGTKDKPIPFESLYIPYIYAEIYFDGVYIDILNQRKNMVIVDVGANIGVTVQHFVPHAKKIYAIEPSKEHYQALMANKVYNHWNNVETFNVAVADKDGEMDFSVNNGNRTMDALVTKERPAAGKVSKVKTVSLDTFFRENKIGQVDFMKFDVEGAEDMILRGEGFRKVADKVNSILVEFHHPGWEDLAQYLTDMGYKARRYKCNAIVLLFTK